MKVVYAETSSILGWLLGEEAPVAPRAVIDSAERVVTSVLTVLEANRGILRATTELRIAANDSSRLKALLAKAAAEWDQMEISADIRARASEPFPVEPVRTLDAVHLATALEFAKVFPEISILSSDRRILSNLEPLGLLTATAEQ